LRGTSEEVAEEILSAWFATEPDESEAGNLAQLAALERDNLR
jgi:hypothetical protein